MDGSRLGLQTNVGKPGLESTNLALAEVLREIVDLLQLKGESAFRVRAYENAAQTIQELSTPITDVASTGRLRDIPGVGEALARKIQEFLETGRMTYLDGLRSEFPDGVRDLMRVPGVGPKLASRVYRELGVQSLAELEVAARDGSLAGLPRLGQKTADNVVRAIERTRAQDNRSPIGQVLPLVSELIEALGNHDFIHNLTAAGSVRRFQETIGDVDIIATSAHAENAMAIFTTLPQVREIISTGTTKSSTISRSGIQVDFRIVQDEAFGSLLQHFTGSKEHNVQLREYALRRGLSLNEYGITDVATGLRTSFADEADFYAALGLPWIPPEIRQGQGEIEAAAQWRLPQLIAVDEIKGDLHAHSNWSDGTASIEDMVVSAAARGYAYVAITDHSEMRANAGGLTVDRLRRQSDEIAAVQERHPEIRILRGSEVDIRVDGSPDFPDSVLEELDWVIASIHSSFNMPGERMTERMLRAIENPHVDAVGHPTGRILGRRPPYELDMEAVFSAAARAGTALEVNSFPDRLDLKDTHIRRAIALGAKIVIDTDAHAPEHFQNVFFGVEVARRGWATRDSVVNASPLHSLLAALGHRT